MNLKETIKNKMDDFLTLCKYHNVKNLYAFGSSITDRFDENLSDIDLLIEIGIEDPIQRGENLLDIWLRMGNTFAKESRTLKLK